MRLGKSEKRMHNFIQAGKKSWDEKMPSEQLFEGRERESLGNEPFEQRE